MLEALVALAWAAGGVLIWIIWESLFFPKKDEVLVVFRLGKDHAVHQGGVHFYLKWLYEGNIVTTKNLHIVVPHWKEKIVKDDTVVLQGDQMRPLRINHKSAKTARHWINENDLNPDLEPQWKLVSYQDYLKHMGCNDGLVDDDSSQGPLTTEWIFYINATIGKRNKDGSYNAQSFYNFVRNVGSSKDLARLLASTGRSVLSEILSQLSPRNAIEAQPLLQSTLKKRLELRVGEDGESTEIPLGANIGEVGLKETEFGKHVNVARAKEGAAISERKATDEETRGMTNRIRETGKAEASAILEKATAQAEGIKKRTEAINAPGGRFAAVAELTETVGKNTKLMQVDSNNGLAVSTAATMAATMNLFKDDVPVGPQQPPSTE